MTALEGLGQDWRMETVSHKFHACCHGTHAMLEALASLRDRVPDPGAPEEIVVYTHPRWLTVCNLSEPATGLEAKFSFRVTAAMALLGIDTAATASFSDALCADPKVQDLRNRVRVEADDSLRETAARVVLRQGDETLEASHDLEAPISPDLRAEKLRAKARALLGEARTEAIWQATAGSDRPAISALVLALGAYDTAA